MRSIDGGLLVQQDDKELETSGDIVTNVKFPENVQNSVAFGVATCKTLKSNAITIVRQNEDGSLQLLGAGMGNPNRIISLQQAVEKAKENGFDNLSDALLVSDAFFPFDDGVKMAASYGIKYVVQPGGSIKDNLVIETANSLEMGMLMTRVRHFNH